MEPTDKETKESSASPSGQQTDEQGGSMSCPMCGACGKSKSPMEKMMGKGPMAMMQKMPAMCRAFIGRHTCAARCGRRLNDWPHHYTGPLATGRR